MKKKGQKKRKEQGGEEKERKRTEWRDIWNEKRSRKFQRIMGQTGIRAKGVEEKWER